MQKLCFCDSIYRNRTKNIDVTEISRDIYAAERAQDQANDDLDAANVNSDMTRTQAADVKYQDPFAPEAHRFKPRPSVPDH